MRALIFTIYIILCICEICKGQLIPFAVIADPDGYTNVRLGENRAIVDRLTTNQIFALRGPVDDDGWQDWYWIDYPDYSIATKAFEKYIHKTKAGMLHQSRIKPITSLPQWQKKHVAKKNLLICRNAKNTIHIEIRYAPFKPDDHRYTKNEQGAILKIDGSEAWGIDGYLYDDMKIITSITLNIGSYSYTFPKEAVKNLLMPNTNLTNFGVSEGSNGVFFLYMSNSDGAGGYDVVWTISNEKCTDQFLYRNF
ncbi:hypothetical protein [Sphingobacterium sp. LRF_L2]|uniref:hypothetical protein n=1 Tax=Sphingobacterium sp. LRF_L2 TaxID=3369421 RepID=UPI003F5D8086